MASARSATASHPPRAVGVSPIASETTCPFTDTTNLKSTMQAVVRDYSSSDSAELFEMFEKRKADIDELMRSVPGFVSYTLARSATGGFSITLCQDHAGIDESVRRAR